MIFREAASKKELNGLAIFLNGLAVVPFFDKEFLFYSIFVGLCAAGRGLIDDPFSHNDPSFNH
jgi:hypothetical protein